MARVYEGENVFLARWFGFVERAFYRLLRISPDEEQDWKEYAKSVVWFSLLFLIPLYVLLRLQGHLPLNPEQPLERHARRRRQHRLQLHHQHELAVLRRRVHDELPDADGRAGGAELHLTPPSAWRCWPR